METCRCGEAPNEARHRRACTRFPVTAPSRQTNEVVPLGDQFAALAAQMPFLLHVLVPMHWGISSALIT